MTENEAIDLDKLIEDAKVLAKEKDTLARTFRNFKDYGNPKSTIRSGAEKAQKEAEQYEHISKLFEELKAYRTIGTIDQINEVIHFLDLENDNGLINDMTLLNQYRAIGTVEELKSMKENGAFTGIELAQLAAMQMRLKEYLAIGTIDEFKVLKEKSVAKKPVRKPNYNWTNEEVTCPSCSRNVSKFRNKYCDCGQKLNWSEEE